MAVAFEYQIENNIGLVSIASLGGNFHPHSLMFVRWVSQSGNASISRRWTQAYNNGMAAGGGFAAGLWSRP
jgi:hypothetical protein